MAVAVLGSINMDLVIRAASLPALGQTLTGQTFFTATGGKGANQAVACARMGVATHLVGRIGADDFGTALRRGLVAHGVDISRVAVTEGIPSGVALITVDDAGENTIIVVPGANGTLGEPDLVSLQDILNTAQVLLLQLEVPLPIVLAAAHSAREQGVQVMLDPAPAQLLPAELYALVDILTPNESEAAALVGFAIQDAQTVEQAALTLLDRGVKNVLIKMGGNGVYWGTRHNGAFQGRLIPAFPVEAVDTVAAGDAFNGSMAAALHEGLPFEEALRWGMAAGAICVTRQGAQSAMPNRAEVLALITSASN